MSQALYRTYRPATFAELVNQNAIKVTLQHEVEHDRIAHAYLFSGPRGIGKTTTARILAKAVNCEQRKGSEPCNTCESCVGFSSGRSVDLIEIDAASHTGVDNVRENIIENARFTPQRAKYKVFIIDEVHMLSVSAFNALLKTLEEPPAHVIFILATTELHRVPETIISRCQRFDFKRVTVDDLVQRLQTIAQLEQVTVEPALLKNIAGRAEGSVRDAEVLLGQILSLGEKNLTEENASLVLPRSNLASLVGLFSAIIHRDASAGISLLNRLVEEGVHLPDFTKEFIEFTRVILLYKVDGGKTDLAILSLDDAAAAEVRALIEVTGISRLVEIIECFVGKSRELRFAPIVQLPLELAVVELCIDEQSGSVPPPPRPSAPASSRPTAPPSAAPKKEPVKAAPVKAKRSGSLISLDQVRTAWPEIITALTKKSRSLGLSLKVGIPFAADAGQVTVAFQYAFHSERVNDMKVRRSLEEVIQSVLGQSLRLVAKVLPADEFKALQPGEPGAPKMDTVAEALEVFGGEVVEEE